MTTFKCKMCGGALEIQLGQTVAECEYCGTRQTVAKSRDEVITNLFTRANNLRMKSEFDRAEQTYEKILEQDNTEAEAHWGLVLCRYGIEYVEDPKTFKRIPTCHRTSYKAVGSDADYLAALEYADLSQKAIYQAEAKAIDDIQKNILAIVKNEKPFDVFICYKESDESGHRTHDSVIANDIYHQLTQEGFKVFYAAVTLEDKLGQEYEPYIFAALNSAKVMLVLGTKPEYFSAVWVKNEWSRFLALMKNDRSKLLIPCYRNMDAYDLPDEFAHLQAQDMSKIGFINDIVRGIKKVVVTEPPKAESAKATQVVAEAVAPSAATAPLLKRAFMFLEDGDWKSADEYCEKVLDIDPECGEAYLGKALAQEKRRSIAELVQARKYATLVKPEKLHLQPDQAHIDEMSQKYSLPGYVHESAISNLYKFDLSYSSEDAPCNEAYEEEQQYWHDHKWLAKAEKYLTGAVAESYAAQKKLLFDTLKERMANAEKAHCEAVEKLKKDYAAHIHQADEQANALYAEGLEKKNAYYQELMEVAKTSAIISQLKETAEKFKALGDYQDSKNLAAYCCKRADEERAKMDAEKARLAEAKRKEAERIAKRKKKIAIIVTPIVCAAIAFLFVLKTVIIPNGKYKDAMALKNEGRYEEAIAAFEAMDGYKDSVQKIEECNIQIYGEEVWNKIKSINVGDTYKFGSYEQDDNKSNGKEEIEWLVLEKDGTKILVISKYALDCQPYNTEWVDVTWETCTLRKWLNNDFLNAAFSAEERARIPTVTVSADKNPSYSTNPGNATQDQVFLLSITEVRQYFGSSSARQCKPMDYAVAEGAYVNSDNGNCWWWLRSPGNTQDCAAYVYSVGDVYEVGISVYFSINPVRPALWINLDS